MDKREIALFRALAETHIMMMQADLPISNERKLDLAIEATKDAESPFLAEAYNVAIVMLIEARAQRDAALIGVKV